MLGLSPRASHRVRPSQNAAHSWNSPKRGRRRADAATQVRCWCWWGFRVWGRGDGREAHSFGPPPDHPRRPGMPSVVYARVVSGEVVDLSFVKERRHGKVSTNVCTAAGVQCHRHFGLFYWLAQAEQQLRSNETTGTAKRNNSHGSMEQQSRPNETTGMAKRNHQ